MPVIPVQTRFIDPFDDIYSSTVNYRLISIYPTGKGIISNLLLQIGDPSNVLIVNPGVFIKDFVTIQIDQTQIDVSTISDGVYSVIIRYSFDVTDPPPKAEIDLVSEGSENDNIILGKITISNGTITNIDYSTRTNNSLLERLQELFNSGSLNTDLNLNNHYIINLATDDPSLFYDDKEAVNKAYVDYILKNIATDTHVKVDSEDSQSGYLDDKLIVADNLTKEIRDNDLSSPDTGNQHIMLISGVDNKISVITGDSTSSVLDDKIVDYHPLYKYIVDGPSGKAIQFKVHYDGEATTVTSHGGQQSILVGTFSIDNVDKAALTVADIFVHKTGNIDEVITGNKTFSNDVTISGNLTVEGSTTTVNTSEMTVEDTMVTLNSNLTSGTPPDTLRSGIEILRGDLGKTSLYWNESIDRWELTDSLNLWKISFNLPDDNTDPLEIYRYNTDTDVTQLRVRIGNDTGTTGVDKFVIGVEDQYWITNLSLDTLGNLYVKGNINFDGSLTGTVDWSNLINVPDPVITLDGDVSGSATMENLLSTTITVTVHDNSHHHDDSTLDNIDWSKVLNKPDPTITLSGDVSGSVTLTNLTSATLSVTVIDDSHNHTDETLGSIDWSKVLNKPDPTITLDGDVSGSVTLTDLTDGTLTVTVHDNSHHHDNTTLDSIDWSKILNKPDPTITLDGDASGSVTLTDLTDGTLTVTVLDDSHKHDSRYYTKSESDSRFVNVTGDTITGDLTIQGTLTISGGSGDVLNLNKITLNLPDSNTDSLEIYRYNVSSDITQLRIRVGDNPGSNDEFVVGLIPSGSTDWVTNLSVNSKGDLYVRGNVNFDGSLSGTVDWSNLVNVPDPTITLSGDVSGSVTLTNLTSGTLSVTVHDNSHHHDNTTLDSIDWSKVLNKPDPTITLSGDVSGSVTLTNLTSGTLSVTVHDSDKLDGKDSVNYLNNFGTSVGNYSTNGYIQAGRGTGGVALTVNDGYGNANVTFNHISGKPEQDGNAARIEVNTDSTSGAYMSFELKSGVTANNAVSLTETLKITETNITYKGHKIWHADNDGPNSGLNADMLDGYHASDILDSITASAILTKLKTVDGSGSGLDADLLDGLHANSFLRRDANSYPTNDNTYDLGSSTHRWSNIYAINFQGTALRAKYADLAEKYICKDKTEIGDVILISTSKDTECEKSNEIGSHRVLGVVSDNPAVIMNHTLKDGTIIALRGRVKCKVCGPVEKGDPLVSYYDGAAISLRICPELNTIKDYIPVFAKALETNKENDYHIIEVVLI